MPAGRPTKMTKSTLDKLETAFAYGCTDAEACFFAGISQALLYIYQNAHPEFLERKDRLKQSPFFKARKSVIDGLADPELALKFLERKKKDEFALRTEHTGENGKPLFIANELYQKYVDTETK